MWPFDRYFRPAWAVLKGQPMPRLLPLVASVAVAALATLTQLNSAHADTPAVAPVVTVPAIAPQVATPTRIALTTTSALPIGSLMIVLDVLGIVEKGAPKPATTTRTATFLSPEPPKTPLFYSSLVVAKF
jgi:hypothetical protein